jgi:hypothetical protein
MATFLEIWEIFCYYYCFLIYYISLWFVPFSFFDANDSQVWPFDGIAELLFASFITLGFFD